MYRRILATFAILFLLISLLGCRKDVSTDTNDNQAIGNSLHFSAWEASYPADIVLLLDQSGSMSQAKNPTDPQGLRALGSRSLLDFIVQSSSPEQPNRFGVVNFGTSAVEAESVPLITVTPSDTTAINRLIARLTPLNLGSTNIYSALELGYRYFHDAGLGTARNRAIVVFTDGEPNDSRGWSQDRYFKEISLYNDRYLAPSGIKLFVIGIDADGGTWSKSIGHWKRILGDKHVFTTPRMDELKGQFNSIVQRIWHLPEVPPVPVLPGKEVTFELEPYLASVEFYIFASDAGLDLEVVRPDGKTVKPGVDQDVLPLKKLTTCQVMVIKNPMSGTWKYKALSGKGSILVMRNPVPIRMKLVTPAPVHPKGKTMRLVAEFCRSDGEPVQNDPNYPLGLSAVVQTGEKRHHIAFPLESGKKGVYTGSPAINGAELSSDCVITLKVSGGGRYHNQYPVNIKVKPIPYLNIVSPSETKSAVCGKSVEVIAELLQDGKPLNPQGRFANHPDQLVIAQMEGETGKANAVWLSYLSEERLFRGRVPMPSDKPGSYKLFVKLAPEDPTMQAEADHLALEFRTVPPLWKQILTWGFAALVVVIAGFMLTRNYRTRKWRCVVYYQTDEALGVSSVVFEAGIRILPLQGLPLKLHRLDRMKFEIVPANGAKLLKSDTEIPSVVLTDAVMVTVVTNDSTRRNVTFALDISKCIAPKPPVKEVEPVAAATDKMGEWWDGDREDSAGIEKKDLKEEDSEDSDNGADAGESETGGGQVWS